MPPQLIPFKTPAGQEELALRVRRLSQRHRTVLLLADGRRTARQVLQMAAAAGVPPECFDELESLGLIASHGAGGPPAADDHLAGQAGPAGHAGMSGSTVAGAAGGNADADARHTSDLAGAFADDAPGHDDLDPPLTPPLTDDAPLEEARAMLLRAVHNESPVTGSITLMKLRRAGSRDAMGALLDEVEQRIRKPRKQIIAAQLLRQVRHLLSLPS